MSHGCVFCGCLVDAEMKVVGADGARECFDFGEGVSCGGFEFVVLNNVC